MDMRKKDFKDLLKSIDQARRISFMSRRPSKKVTLESVDIHLKELMKKPKFRREYIKERNRFLAEYYQNEKFEYTKEELDKLDKLCKQPGKVFYTAKAAIAYIRKLCEHKHRWDKQNIVGKDYVCFVKVCSKCQVVETEIVRT